MMVKKILSRCSLETHENTACQHQRAIRMESLSEEDAGVVFWEDFCDLHGWPRTPTTANIHRYIEMFVNNEEKNVNIRWGLAMGDKGFISGHDLFIKPVLRLKARLVAAQNAAAKLAALVHALPEPKMPSDGNVQVDDTFCVTASSNDKNINHMRPLSELDTDSDGEDYFHGEDYENKRAAFAITSRASKKSRLDIFSIPEIALLISRFLDSVDLGRLCQTSKGLQNVFHSMFWRHYVFVEDDRLTEALSRNLVHLRSLDLNVYILDSRLFKFFGQCNSLTRLHFCADEEKNELFYNSYDRIECLHLLISTIGQQYNLTQLELNTRLVLHCPDTFLSAFLALQQLRQLRIYMTTKMPTIPTALKMVVDLLNRHPRVEAIRFGDWCCSEPLNEPEINYEIGKEEMDTFNELELQLRASGYHMITALELPPRQYHSYPATFLESLFRSGLPNLQSLRLPEAETSPARDLGLAIRSGCPKLQQFIFTPRAGSGAGYFPEIHNILENCNTLSSISVKGTSIIDEQHLCRHAETLTVLILSYFAEISSATLHKILLQSSVLKVLRLEKAPSALNRDYNDLDFMTGRWSCAGLEVLWLIDCVKFKPRRVMSLLQGHKFYPDSRKHLWTQVGYLSKLQELEIGSTKVAGISDMYKTKELRLGALSKAQNEEEEDNPGLLHLLHGLRNLRVLRVQTDNWPRWILPGQAEVEFMERNWPCFREFSYINHFYPASGESLKDEPQWRWLKRQRQGFVVKGSLNLDEPGRPSEDPINELEYLVHQTLADPRNLNRNIFNY